ncbi:MAG: hypothetical protein N3I35_17200 [Clostridia bacterium]|nr:hypothetical protein [Clostridia bacterium]
MKVLRILLATFLILVIIGGLGYIAYSLFFMGGMNHQGMNNTPETTAPSHNQAADTGSGQNVQNQHGSTHQGNASPNTAAVQSRDRLNQAIGMINQAIDLISIDPYSKATLPSASQGNIQSTQGGTVNVYPNGNTSVNVAPPANNTPNKQTPPANTNQGTVNTQEKQNYVYDQGKLQQLHSGIFTLAQGIMTINQLGDDLLIQSSMAETNPPDYRTHVQRYNIALQNKTKLNNAINLLNQASTLINVNPYGGPDGYPYNKDAMAQLHQGVFKLAQGMTMLNRLNEDFTAQMAIASSMIQSITNNAYQTQTMNHSTMGLFSGINTSTVFNLILIVMVVGLIAGILGAIFSVFRNDNTRRTGGSNSDNDSTLR